MGKLTEKAEGNRKYLAGMDSRMYDKAKQIANINQMKDRVEKRRKQISVMNKFKSALIDTEGLLRNRLVTSINSMVQSVWSEIYPYADYSGVRLEASKDDYRLEAGTSIGGAEIRWAEVDGMASGGERSMACLAMRIALAMVVVPNLKWLILDEPTHNIDENGIVKFVDMLGNTLPKVVEQVFVITHDSELKQVNAARVYQLERDKDSNGHTKVVEL
jgi:DNA repair exonuclease SbcCD ATPase subunit